MDVSVWFGLVISAMERSSGRVLNFLVVFLGFCLLSGLIGLLLFSCCNAYTEWIRWFREELGWYRWKREMSFLAFRCSISMYMRQCRLSKAPMYQSIQSISK